MGQNMELPRRDYVFNKAQMIPRKDVHIPCGITKKCTCASVTEIFVMEWREQAALVWRQSGEMMYSVLFISSDTGARVYIAIDRGMTE